MPNSSTSTLVGWLLSFSLYIVIIFVGIMFIQEHLQKTEKYTASKKNLLNVTLVERKKTIPKKKKIVKKKKTVQKKKEAVKTQKKTVRTEKTTPTKSLKSLFDNIDLDKLPLTAEKKEKKIRKKVVKKKVEEVVEQKRASKIAKSLKFEEQESLIITQKDGIYDEFKGRISDILDTNWQETIDTVSGNMAEVVIGVNNLGNFSYKIEKLSYNDDFNAKLREFLEAMKDEEFPPFTKGEIFYMKVVFKDILER